MAFLQILLIDISMAGDNVLAVGIAASGLPQAKRHQGVAAGLVIATVLRIVFAFLAVRLLHIPGVLTLGGFLLLWVSWKMFGDLRHGNHGSHEATTSVPQKTFAAAMVQIIIADVSMSLDNILAVAGAAQDNKLAMVLGVVVAVLLMGTAATLVARLIRRHPWVGYLGLMTILYTAIHMLWQGSQDIPLLYKLLVG